MNAKGSPQGTKRRGRPPLQTPAKQKFGVHFDAQYLTEVKEVAEKKGVPFATVIREDAKAGRLIDKRNSEGK